MTARKKTPKMKRMEVLLITLFALLGAAIGSFMNVCIDRVPAGKSLAYPPSHCAACGHPLSPLDLIPVLSYLMLRGRCRYCHGNIPRRILLVELLGAALFAFLYRQYGPSLQFALMAYYGCLVIVIGIIDLEHGLIPNRIVYPAAGVALIIDVFAPQPGIVNGLIGGGAGLILMLLPALVFRGGMGWGDIKMAGVIGLAVGFPLVFVSLLMAVIIGGAVAALLLLLKIKRWKEPIPFGPFLSVSMIVTLLWGSAILNWYLGLS